MNSFDKWDIRHLQLARLVASWSKDPSTQTGAVISNGKKVISLGFNGFPEGMPDDPESYADRENKYSRVVHCEVNAVLLAERSVRGFTLYTYPFMSCDRCAVTMIQAGIKKCVFPTLAEDKMERWAKAMEKSWKYFKECGVECVEVPHEVI